MSFRFYGNMISQASRRLAGGIFATGLTLIGFGLLIYLMPRFFATLAAMIFFITGIGACTTAVKIFWSARRMRNHNANNEEYRENVRVRIEDHYDI